MKNIFLIENDNDVVHLIVSALDTEKYSLDVFESLMAAADTTFKNIPELIICNRCLYEKEYKAVKGLKDEYLSVPFIFLLDDKFNKKIDDSHIIEYYIKKPFGDIEIQNLIKLAFERFDTLNRKSERQLNDLRGSISFSLPHEFFTPLNGILGFSELLIRDYDTLAKPEQVQMLRYINKDAFRLKKLTENFLAYVKLEMMQNNEEEINELKKTYYINPKEIIQQVTQSAAQEFNRKDDIVYELEDAVIRISEEYIRKMLYEIVNNAFKFSKKNTPVIVSLLTNDTSCMLSVADSGIGMTPAQISSVGAYMQFNRKQNEQQGSGLGLVIAKKIAGLHGGEFRIESIPGEGTKIITIFEN